MANKRGFGASIAEEVMRELGNDTPDAQATPKVLTRRQTAISKLSGDIVYDQDEWVDPAICRPSSENARDYSQLTYENCRDLIEGIKSEGQQRFPSIVRRVEGGDATYEVVAGLRRHFAITWLRDNNYPSFKYLINVQKLDDESAFRLSDLENRSRTDITDLERGISYRSALERHYHGDYERMADRMAMTSRNLRRYIELADLDADLIAALGGQYAAKITHASTLKTEARKSTKNEEAILAEAELLAAQQAELREAGKPLIPAAQALKQLLDSTKGQKPPKQKEKPVSIATASGVPVLELAAGTARTAATIRILPKANATLDEMKKAASDAIEQIYSVRKKR